MSSPYDQNQRYYETQYPAYNQVQSSYYPSEGYAQSYQQQQAPQQQPYYPDSRAPHDQPAYTQNAQSYYGTGPQQTPASAEADRGLLGALGGGAAGAWGGHKAGHGVLGALGGAILGSLTEDYAKKHKKHSSKPPKQNQQPYYGRATDSSMSSGSGLGGMANSLFNHKR